MGWTGKSQQVLIYEAISVSPVSKLITLYCNDMSLLTGFFYVKNQLRC